MSYTFRVIDEKGRNKRFTAIAEIEKVPDRSTAVIGGAFVEAALQEALVDHLHKDKSITKELFHPNNALGAFQTKIRLCKLTGIYGDPAFKDLIRMCRIRNEFAHRPEISSFDDQPVVD